MILAHANYLVACGWKVHIRVNIVNTVFCIDSRIVIELISTKSKIATLWSALSDKQDCNIVIADIIPLACLLFFRNRGKVVYFAQDYDESYYANLPQKYFIRVLYYLGLFLFRIKTIAVAQHLVDTLCKRFFAQVVLVENGVDVAVFYPDPDLQLLTAKNGRKSILLFSRADRRKGFDVAIRVIHSLQAKTNSPYEIWTVGEPVSGVFLDRTHRDFGYVSEDRLRSILSSADIFLYPSQHEGFPLMPMEAFACRCAVVTTHAVPYAVNEVNALVSEIGDVTSLTTHICSLLDASRNSSGLVNAGWEYAMIHTLEKAKTGFAEQLCKFM